MLARGGRRAVAAHRGAAGGEGALPHHARLRRGRRGRRVRGGAGRPRHRRGGVRRPKPPPARSHRPRGSAATSPPSRAGRMRPSRCTVAPRRLVSMIEAAGGVVWRRGSKGSLKVLLVHRPRYDDWSLPKGKLDPGESHRHAALREVEEETGLRCKLGEELPEVRYEDRKGRAKRVRYWSMEPVDGDLRAERRGRRGALGHARRRRRRGHLRPRRGRAGRPAAAPARLVLSPSDQARSAMVRWTLRTASIWLSPQRAPSRQGVPMSFGHSPREDCHVACPSGLDRRRDRARSWSWASTRSGRSASLGQLTYLAFTVGGAAPRAGRRRRLTGRRGSSVALRRLGLALLGPRRRLLGRPLPGGTVRARPSPPPTRRGSRRTAS